MQRSQEAGQAVAGRVEPRWIVVFNVLDGLQFILARDSYKDADYWLMPELDARDGHIPVFPTKEDAESYAVLWKLGDEHFEGDLHTKLWNG